MPWGHDLIDNWAVSIRKNVGTGLKDNVMQTPDRPVSNGGMPTPSAPPGLSAPPGTWQAQPTSPPQNPPDLAKLPQHQAPEVQQAAQVQQGQQQSQMLQMQLGPAVPQQGGMFDGMQVVPQQQGLLPLMHQPVTSLGISTVQNVSFGRHAQAQAQPYACMNFKSAMPDPSATEDKWKAHERNM